MTMNEMMTAYERLSASHVYALGFVHAGLLYAVKLSFAQLSEYFKIDRASSKRGGFAKIRIKLTSAQRAELAKVADLLGTDDLLTKDAKYNKGDNFERELTERWAHKVWKKSSIPFYVAGDIQIDGINIQVKFDYAELTNEKILTMLGA